MFSMWPHNLFYDPLSLCFIMNPYNMFIYFNYMTAFEAQLFYEMIP